MGPKNNFLIVMRQINIYEIKLFNKSILQEKAFHLIQYTCQVNKLAGFITLV